MYPEVTECTKPSEQKKRISHHSHEKIQNTLTVNQNISLLEIDPTTR